MLDNLKQTLSTDKIRQSSQEAVDDARRRLDRARGDLRLARSHGRVRLWTLGTDALSRAHAVLDKAPGGLGPVVGPLRKAVDGQLDKLTSPSIEDYDGLNARAAADAVRDLDLVHLERIERYERAHKNRKTVLGALERERRRLKPREA